MPTVMTELSAYFCPNCVSKVRSSKNKVNPGNEFVSTTSIEEMECPGCHMVYNTFQHFDQEMSSIGSVLKVGYAQLPSLRAGRDDAIERAVQIMQEMRRRDRLPKS